MRNISTYRSYGRARRSTPLYVALLPLLVLSVVAAVQYVRPVPDPTTLTLVESAITLGEVRSAPPLPATGAAAVVVKGLGPIAATGPQQPRPIASMTKTMTAYVLLKGHPLRAGERGPTITVTQADVSAYLRAIAQDQSAVPVAAGQVYTLYEALQLLLLSSANNFADMLAVWDSGSVQAFVAKMNAEARALGMTNTTYADASGFSTASVSTPADQLMLAMAAMESPVLAEIVGQREALVSNVGRVFNTNPLLGQEGIIGLKTGYTEEAGGCLLFVARREAGGQSFEVYGVVMGLPTRQQAFDAAFRLVASVGAGVQNVAVVSKARPVGEVRTPWGARADVLPAEDLRLLAWPGMTLETRLEYDAIDPPLPRAAGVGRLTVQLGEQTLVVPVRLAAPLSGPTLLWRLTRI